MGIRLQQVHHRVDDEGRLCVANNDEHVSNRPVVLIWDRLLFLGKAVQEVDCAFKCASDGRYLDDVSVIAITEIV